MNKILKRLNYNNSQINNTLLYTKLHTVLREYFNLRVQLKLGRLKQCHLLKRLRYEISCIKLSLSKK